MFIQDIDLFSGLPSDMMDEISKLFIEKVYPAGGVLFRRGESAEALFILKDGWVDISIGGKGHTSFLVNCSGDVFGWSALLEPRQHRSSATCVKESKVIKINGDRLVQIFERHPAEGLRVLRRLAGIIASRLVSSYEAALASMTETKEPSYG